MRAITAAIAAPQRVPLPAPVGGKPPVGGVDDGPDAAGPVVDGEGEGAEELGFGPVEVGPLVGGPLDVGPGTVDEGPGGTLDDGELGGAVVGTAEVVEAVDGGDEVVEVAGLDVEGVVVGPGAVVVGPVVVLGLDVGGAVELVDDDGAVVVDGDVDVVVE